MNIHFKNLIKAYSGKCDGLVYYYHPRYERFFARRLPKFQPNASTQRMGLISKQLKALQVSEGFKNDLKIYCGQYQSVNREYRYPCWSNIFSKLFWALSRSYDVDLSHITKVQIYSEALPVRSVKEAVGAGLLPEVPGWEYLGQLI